MQQNVCSLTEGSSTETDSGTGQNSLYLPVFILKAYKSPARTFAKTKAFSEIQNIQNTVVINISIYITYIIIITFVKQISCV